MNTLPQVGDRIVYKMRLSERPINPLRLWHGVVEKECYPICWVRLTDEGYEELRELVLGYQIVEVISVNEGNKR
jgi:hypothetical protein